MHYPKTYIHEYIDLCKTTLLVNGTRQFCINAVSRPITYVKTDTIQLYFILPSFPSSEFHKRLHDRTSKTRSSSE